ncbi:hypothetical protein cypCar_00050293, partial [Cyprinus carpio]
MIQICGSVHLYHGDKMTVLEMKWPKSPAQNRRVMSPLGAICHAPHLPTRDIVQ